MSISIINNDLGSVILQDAKHQDKLLTFSGAATVKEGTILATQIVDVDVTAVADGGNTGDGTVTSVTAASGGVIVPLSGDYILTCTETLPNGGAFELVDPNAAIVQTAITLVGGTPLTTTVGGLTFTITDGTTDFAVGDFFTLTVVANGKLVPFEKDGAGGAQLPKYVLTYAVTATGAGDKAIRALMSGQVRKERLIINSDGDNSNVDSTVVEQLRNYSIIAINVEELSLLDNQ